MSPASYDWHAIFAREANEDCHAEAQRAKAGMSPASYDWHAIFAREASKDCHAEAPKARSRASPTRHGAKAGNRRELRLASHPLYVAAAQPRYYRDCDHPLTIARRF